MLTGETCPYCGEDASVELFEVWGHEFQIETCCADYHEEMVFEMQDEGFRLALLRQLDAEALTGLELRRVADDGCGSLLLDYALRIVAARPDERNALNDYIEAHHEHCGRLPTWRYAAWIYNGRTRLGCVIVGNPTARAYMGRGWVEVRRLCLARNISAALRWKACSMLYGWAVDEAKRRGFSKIITYTLADSESGMSLRYARWKPEARIRGKTWHTPSRPRQDNAPVEDKIRWTPTLNAEWTLPAPEFKKAA
jgi:hypothetical protein